MKSLNLLAERLRDVFFLWITPLFAGEGGILIEVSLLDMLFVLCPSLDPPRIWNGSPGKVSLEVEDNSKVCDDALIKQLSFAEVYPSS